MIEVQTCEFWDISSFCSVAKATTAAIWVTCSRLVTLTLDIWLIIVSFSCKQKKAVLVKISANIFQVILKLFFLGTLPNIDRWAQSNLFQSLILRRRVASNGVVLARCRPIPLHSQSVSFSSILVSKVSARGWNPSVWTSRWKLLPCSVVFHATEKIDFGFPFAFI